MLIFIKFKCYEYEKVFKVNQNKVQETHAKDKQQLGKIFLTYMNYQHFSNTEEK